VYIAVASACCSDPDDGKAGHWFRRRRICGHGMLATMVATVRQREGRRKRERGAQQRTPQRAESVSGKGQ
jgi:hypothetical protein